MDLCRQRGAFVCVVLVGRLLLPVEILTGGQAFAPGDELVLSLREDEVEVLGAINQAEIYNVTTFAFQRDPPKQSLRFELPQAAALPAKYRNIEELDVLFLLYKKTDTDINSSQKRCALGACLGTDAFFHLTCNATCPTGAAGCKCRGRARNSAKADPAFKRCDSGLTCQDIQGMGLFERHTCIAADNKPVMTRPTQPNSAKPEGTANDASGATSDPGVNAPDTSSATRINAIAYSTLVFSFFKSFM